MMRFWIPTRLNVIFLNYDMYTMCYFANSFLNGIIFPIFFFKKKNMLIFEKNQESQIMDGISYHI
jgi:hypothetical protein